MSFTFQPCCIRTSPLGVFEEEGGVSGSEVGDPFNRRTQEHRNCMKAVIIVIKGGSVCATRHSLHTRCL